MKPFLTFAAIVLCGNGAQADPVFFAGTIGPYEIEAELDREGEGLTGRYRYAGRDAWLDLSGEVFGHDAIQLSEFDGQENTGAFYLSATSEGFTGFWAHGEVDHAATLLLVRGRVADLMDPIEEIDVSADLTGRYEAGSYWVNEWFAPNYEIGFNGGAANVVHFAPDTMLVGFQFVVGPTYHIASFQGLAGRSEGDTFVYEGDPYGSGDTCHLEFRFSKAGLSILDENNGFACGFGMRAHANFDLPKVSDTAEFSGSW